MWDAVRLDDIDFHDCQRVLEALLTTRDGAYRCTQGECQGRLGRHHRGMHWQQPRPQGYPVEFALAVGSPSIPAEEGHYEFVLRLFGLV